MPSSRNKAISAVIIDRQRMYLPASHRRVSKVKGDGSTDCVSVTGAL